MRKHKSESELRAIAEAISDRIYIDRNGCGEAWRKATRKQKEITYGVIYGALLGLDWGEKVRSTSDIEQGIVDTAEFTWDIMIKPYAKLEDGRSVNGYITIYCPLKKVLKEWEEESLS